MKIVESQSAVLTNFEVLQIIEAEQAEYSGRDGEGKGRPMPRNLERVLKDAHTYFHRKESPIKAGTQYSNAAIKNVFSRIGAKYKLEKGEYLMLFNVRPKNLAELEVIIEEAGNRFKEEELEEILQIVAEELGVEDTEAGAEEMEEDGME